MPGLLRAITLPLALGALLVTQRSAWAQTQNFPVVNIESELNLSFSDLIKNYKEYFAPISGNIYDRENGSIPGFTIGGSIMRDVGAIQHLYGSIQFRYDSGSIAYTGSTLGGVPVSQTNQITQKDVRGEFGKGFLLGDRLMVIPVVQLGYHTWNRDIYNVNPIFRNLEVYSNLYVGAALHVDYAVSSRLVVRGRAGIATTASPQINVGLIDATAPLGIRPVYQLGGGLDYALTKHLHLTAYADFSHYSYGKSPFVQAVAPGDDAPNSYYEPNSVTNDLYVEGGIAYSF